MDLDRGSRALLGIACGGLGSLGVAGGLVGIRGEISNVSVALVLALVVLGAACIGGRTAGELVETLGLKGCHYEQPPFLTELPHLELDGAIPGAGGAFRRRGYRLPRAGVDLRVMRQRGVVGRFVLEPAPGTSVSAERLLVAVSLAHALGLALTPVLP